MAVKTFYLVDASSYIFRAFYASPAMHTKAGQPTNALYVFTKMILSLLATYKPDSVGIVFDAAGKKFRHEIFEAYKANRSAPPDELKAQFPYFRPIMESLGLACYELEGYEADDIIASLCKKALMQSYKVCVISGDKDLMQLIKDDRCEMLDTMAKPPRLYTVKEVKERFGVEPRLVADVLALAGDSSDNIPGAKGIGEKTAGTLIAQYGSLEELMEKAEEITAKARRENLIAFREQAPLSKKLTSLIYDLPVEPIFEPLEPDIERINDLFSAFEFTGLKKQVLKDFTKKTEAAPVSEKSLPSPQASLQGSIFDLGVESAQANDETLSKKPVIVVEGGEWLKYCEKASSETKFFLDFFLASKAYEARVMGASLACQDFVVYAPLKHRDLTYINQLEEKPFWEGVGRLLESKACKIVHSLKPLSILFAQRGLNFDISSVFDLEIASYLINSESSKHDFSSISKRFLNRDLHFNPETWLGTGKATVSLDQVSVSKASEAGAEWSECALELYPKLDSRLKSDDLYALYREIELPISIILGEMENEGIGVDLDRLNELSQIFKTKMREIEKEAEELAGRPFNLLSPKQVGALLYDELALKPKHKKSRQHGMSTDSESLESLVDEHPLPALILEYRSYAKMHATYSLGLATSVDSKTKRIHGLFHQCVTATGRLSSSEPNLQNIPTRSDIGKKIRATFISRPGYSFVSADYSQIELRIMAHFSQEPVLIEAFKSGEDIHQITAASIFNKAPAEISSDERRVGKTINFGVLYGMGAAKMARETGSSAAEAKSFIEAYHRQFPRLEAFFKQLKEEAQKIGYVTTLMRRRRYTPAIHSSRPQLRAFAERTAVNSPIQGSAADLMKVAMIRVHEAFGAERLDAKILIQVHDELIVECSDKDLERCKNLIVQCMEEVYSLRVPLKVDVSVSKFWN